VSSEGVGSPQHLILNAWGSLVLAALCMAVSAWGQAFTGLPIDFQFQPVAWANETYGRGHIREPLGVRITG
jgi:hypothetical protein